MTSGRDQYRRKVTAAAQRIGRVTVNPIVLKLIRSPLQVPGLSSGTVLRMTTAGRRSGKTRVTPMGYVPAGPNVLLVVSERGSRADWYRNAVSAGWAQVEAGGRRGPATVKILEDEDPGLVLSRMNPMLRLANRALWSDPAVVEIRFTGTED